MRRALASLALLAALPAAAQAYKVTDQAINAGGHPSQGTVMASTTYRITLDAIGDAVVARGLSSASFRTDTGFVAGYPAPGEVGGLSFTSKTDLAWTAEPSAGRYALYRDPLSTLPGSGGTCLASNLGDTRAVDAAAPAAGSPWFYLVTVRNRLGEEGTRGSRSSGAERPETGVCP